MGALSPRLLLTGFGPFPGAPENPTALLLERLRAEPPPLDGLSAFRAEVLDVDYATIAASLSVIGRDFSPDIAIHFGLAQECTGFRLERLARNTHASARPDQSGGMPASSRVCAGPDTLGSTLPLDLIAARLGAEGLPVQWSDDAGGYLCNTVFTLSVAHACEGFAPAMSGFVHVPPLSGTNAPDGSSMSVEDLLRGARIIVASCVNAWGARNEPGSIEGAD